MTEVWKDIPGWEGLYQVSNTGKVKSLYKERINGRGGLRKYPERILKPSTTKRGYYIVSLQNNRVNWKTIHRLVATVFVPNPDNKPEVNHEDGDKTNNNDWNLKWSTRKENAVHAEQTGLFNNKRDLKTGQFIKHEESYI